MFYGVPRTFLLIGIITILIISTGFSQDDGATWLQQISDAETIPYSYSVVEQTITTSSGSERTMTIRSWSAEDGDLSIMVYTDPARVRGDKILQRDGGDNIWYYMHRRDATRHFVGHSRRQSAMGSDFSYEDLASGDMTEDYTAEFQGYEELDGENCVKLKCVPTETGPSYAYIILWASAEDNLTRKIEYYDEDGFLKTLFLSDFQVIEGRKLPLRMLMENHREDSHTLMVTSSITFAEEPDASMFTTDALTREFR